SRRTQRRGRLGSGIPTGRPVRGKFLPLSDRRRPSREAREMLPHADRQFRAPHAPSLPPPPCPAGRSVKSRRSPTRRVWRTLAAAIWRFRRRTLAAVGLVVLAKLASVSVPIALKRIIDELSVQDVALALPVYLLLAYAILRLLVTVFGELRDVVFARVV